MRKIISALAVSALTFTIGIVGSGVAQAATPTLTMSGGNAVYGLGPAVITATASVEGTVEFFVDGKSLPGCQSIPTSSATPFVARCSWVAEKSGPAKITGKLSPKDTVNYTVAESPVLTVKVGVPVQGEISPIHIYVDTVLASGSTGDLAPRFNSCAITNEYLVGQTIVFRVYANNENLGGEVMDTTNTAKAYIEIAGIKDPINLSYGNHSGVAFWTAILKTGTGAGLYNTLGVINYKVTMVAKDTNKIKVLTTKLMAKKIDGVRVKDENGRYVYERVPYYRTVTITPALKGAVGEWQSNFTSTSQLTLFAVPVKKS